MGRIQKKLYLSAKVTETMRDVHLQSATKIKKGPGGRIVESAENDMPQLDTTQLMSLVRRGAQAISRPELDVNEMLSWDFSTMIEKCKDQVRTFRNFPPDFVPEHESQDTTREQSPSLTLGPVS